MVKAEQELKRKRILVTGAAGFIGSRLVKALLDLDAEVVALVDEALALTRIEPLLANPKLHLMRCTLSDIPALATQRRKWGDIDLVAHLGLHVPRSERLCEQFIEDINMNLLATMNLIKILDDSVQGICFASSVSVYGCPAHLSVKESVLPAPVSSYGATKLAIENFLSSYGRTNQIPITILRYASVYGPGEFEHRAIPNFLHAIVEGQPPIIYGDGSEIRDYIYIDDVVRATILALANRPARVLNIGSGHSYTTRHIAREVLRLCSSPVVPQFIPAEKQNINITLDITAAKKALSYSSRTSLEKGLKQEIEWYQKQARASAPAEENEHAPVPKSRRGLRCLITYLFWKNAVDRLLAFLLIIVSSPLLALIAVGIKLDSHESPIFTQERVGKNGIKFIAYKFRTMCANHNDSKYKSYLRKYVLENAPYRVDHNGQSIYKVDDPPLTRFGVLLRKTNLDELPQLFNVLKGEMSLVGPRPDIPFAVAMYKDWHQKRLDAKPGMTGLWQVCKRKSLSFESMVHLDIDYITRQSMYLDAKILFLTLGTVLRRDGS
jgi:nucleoside-diphosphate-sugar epimerase/lipopolysaccharide/colanic/teichoic acid biosynthesis glycosyltransferase